MFRTKVLAILIALAAFGSIAIPASSAASTTCPSGYSCVPANKTVTNSSNSSSSSYTKIVIKETIKEDVEEYEQTTHKVVGFDMNVASTSHGLTDCHWGDYAWSGWTLIDGKVVYNKIPPHGQTHVCWNGKNWIQTGGGDKQWNCGNIDYPYGQTPPKKEQVKNIVTFHTHKQFLETFKKWVTSRHHSTSTKSSKTLYSCMSGWTLQGTQCLQQIPPTATPPTPVATCNDTSATNYGQNGACVYQSAQQTCQGKYNGSWDSNTQTCIVVVGNCSTIYVINGNGNVVGGPTNSGNCNTTTPPTPPATPVVSLGGFPQFNEIQAGGNSGNNPLCVPTYASDGNASVTISSDLGFVAASASATDPQSSMTESATQGNGEACFVLFAPNDSDTPASMTVTVSINDGTATPASETSDPIGITYPENTRPS
jgi:hypothetical protein